MSDTPGSPGYQQPTPPNPDEETPEEEGEPREAPDTSDTLTKGFAAVHEADDNALADSDPDFIGTDPVYKNYADETLMPLAAEEGPEKELEERAKEWAEDLAKQSSKAGFQGFTPNAPHPSEARQPAADAIDQNRAIQQRAAGGR